MNLTRSALGVDLICEVMTMRTIDADRLKETLEYCTTKGMGSTIAFTFKHIIDEQPTIEPEQQWIPCNERLPDGGTECLITVDGKHETWDERTLNYYHVQVAMFTEDLYKIDDCKFYDRKGKAGFYVKNDEGCYHEVEYVTAWLPLPEPYKGGNK